MEPPPPEHVRVFTFPFDAQELVEAARLLISETEPALPLPEDPLGEALSPDSGEKGLEERIRLLAAELWKEREGSLRSELPGLIREEIRLMGCLERESDSEGE